MPNSILIVDDHPTNLKLLSFALRARGFTVVTAADAEQALAAIKAEKPKLILMDLQLPGMSGYDLTTQIKRDPATAEVPVIAVTGYAMKGDEERALAAGCDGYITKPVDLTVLRDLVARLVPQTPPLPMTPPADDAPPE